MGLRERKLLRTRARLIEAAVTLCLSDGYDSATVEAIAAAADVSPRTFNRYFATKDAVFMAVMGGMADYLLAELREQSEDLNPLEALRSAYAAVLRRAIDRPDGKPSADQVALVLRVISSADVLRQKAIEYRDDRVTQLLADRAGVPTDHPRVQVALALFSATTVIACARLVSETPAELLGPSLIAARLDRAFGLVAELAAGLDPSLGYQTRTQSTSMSAG